VVARTFWVVTRYSGCSQWLMWRWLLGHSGLLLGVSGVLSDWYGIARWLLGHPRWLLGRSGLLLGVTGVLSDWYGIARWLLGCP